MSETGRVRSRRQRVAARLRRKSARTTEEQMRAVQRGLRARAAHSREAAGQEPKDSPRAAALRGKAGGYIEAADMIEAMLRNGTVRQKYPSASGSSPVNAPAREPS